MRHLIYTLRLRLAKRIDPSDLHGRIERIERIQTTMGRVLGEAVSADIGGKVGLGYRSSTPPPQGIRY